MQKFERAKTEPEVTTAAAPKKGCGCGKAKTTTVWEKKEPPEPKLRSNKKAKFL